MAYRIISADCHIDMTWMPGNLWVENAPARWRDHVPRCATLLTDRTGMPRGRSSACSVASASVSTACSAANQAVERMFEAGLYEGGPHPTTPALRLKDQEIDGIDAEVMYGILGIGQRLHNPKLIQVVYEVYNTWAADFCKSDPRRLVGLACLPSHDPQAAAHELRRPRASGLKGADFPVSTAAYPIWHGAWDPLWEAARGLPHADLLPHHRVRGARACGRGDEEGVRPPVSRHAHDDVPALRRRVPGQHRVLRRARPLPGLQVRARRGRGGMATVRPRPHGRGVRRPVLPARSCR